MSKAFMVPQYTNDPFVELNDEYGDMYFIASECYTEEDKNNIEYEFIEEHIGKFFARLSAPGYLDCTEWSGPFDTIQEAYRHIEELFDVHPVTGEYLYDIENEE